MTSSQPLLPPRHQSICRVHEISWSVLLLQLNRLNEAFEAAQATHPSPEAKKIWSEARRSAAKKMRNLQDVAYVDYNTANDFLDFLKALQTGRGNPGAYETLIDSARQAVNETDIAQEALLKFREDLRIVAGKITTLMSDDCKDMTSFQIESSQSMLELATAIEECNALLEEHREELKEVQQQSLDENDNLPSEEEFQMVQEKWLAFEEASGPQAYKWLLLQHKMAGPDDSDEPVITSDNPRNPTRRTNLSKSRRISFWRKFFRRISSCLPN
ncbi:hypothetical protein Agabi119p4_7886 [Agaricus bisporus var. burnettii]|uniref:Uncharacterized protein n=1 Tax=Agaricus bisporus var. burnettii TaxID=192524 RepID=A0A8H7C8Z2_AGABI|nr:hypothetical protein Agabi119p4_7886 [Agaricus bisporus var. burnettii]